MRIIDNNILTSSPFVEVSKEEFFSHNPVLVTHNRRYVHEHIYVHDILQYCDDRFYGYFEVKEGIHHYYMSEEVIKKLQIKINKDFNYPVLDSLETFKNAEIDSYLIYKEVDYKKDTDKYEIVSLNDFNLVKIDMKLYFNTRICILFPEKNFKQSKHFIYDNKHLYQECYNKIIDEFLFNPIDDVV